MTKRVIRDPLLRAEQRKWDKEHLDAGYVELSDRKAKIQHVGANIGVTLFRLIEVRREVQRKKLPDSEVVDYTHPLVVSLLMERTQLLNELRVPRSEADLLINLPVSSMGLAAASENVGHARGLVDSIIRTPEKNGPTHRRFRRELIEVGIPELHTAAMGLAKRFKHGDPVRLHAAHILSGETKPVQ